MQQLSSTERDSWIEAYIEAQCFEKPVQSNHPCWWSIERFIDMNRLEEAENCWTTLLGVLARSPPERVLGMLAAGPLEDLIHYWGPDFIERIEQTAWESIAFRQLLKGVWKSSTEEVWGRVERAASGQRPMQRDRASR